MFSVRVVLFAQQSLLTHCHETDSNGQLSEAVTEALADLQEIAQLGIDEDDDMEEQAALFEQVVEHVRMCVLSCHSELGQRPVAEDAEEKPTLH